MIPHDIFIESHPVEDGAKDTALAVLCTCSAILLEEEGQLGLDEIVEAAWAHRDAQSDRLMCGICE